MAYFTQPTIYSQPCADVCLPGLLPRWCLVELFLVQGLHVLAYNPVRPPLQRLLYWPYIPPTCSQAPVPGVSPGAARLPGPLSSAGIEKGPRPFGLDPYTSNIPHYRVQFYAIFFAQKVRGATTATNTTQFSLYTPIIDYKYILCRLLTPFYKILVAVVAVVALIIF